MTITAVGNGDQNDRDVHGTASRIGQDGALDRRPRRHPTVRSHPLAEHTTFRTDGAHELNQSTPRSP